MLAACLTLPLCALRKRRFRRVWSLYADPCARHALSANSAFSRGACSWIAMLVTQSSRWRTSTSAGLTPCAVAHAANERTAAFVFACFGGTSATSSTDCHSVVQGPSGGASTTPETAARRTMLASSNRTLVRGRPTARSNLALNACSLCAGMAPVAHARTVAMSGAVLIEEPLNRLPSCTRMYAHVREPLRLFVCS